MENLTKYHQETIDLLKSIGGRKSLRKIIDRFYIHFKEDKHIV